MENKTLAYLGLGVALLLFVGTFAMGGMGGMNGRSVSSTGDMADHHNKEQPTVSNAVGSMDGHHGRSGQFISLSSEDLDKYRSEEIPEACRLPEDRDDIESWKQHLGHHQNTLYCLEYYK